MATEERCGAVDPAGRRFDRKALGAEVAMMMAGSSTPRPLKALASA